MRRYSNLLVLCLLLVAMVPHVAIADGSLAPVRGGESAAAARGRAAHEAFKEQVSQKPGWTPNPRLRGKNGETPIPDALDPKGRPVELKPNTTSGCAQGARQIKKYKEATGTNGRIIYYGP